MNDEIKSFSQAASQIYSVLRYPCLNASEVKLVKRQVQNSYNSFVDRMYEKSFLNWGLYDKKIHDEYRELDFNFSTLCPYQDVYSQLLVYYLIRPLIKKQFFNKRLLEVGCGNGIGLKVGSELLKTNYALGVDLVHKLASNSNRNFYSENKVNYIQSDAENLALENESFDIVTNLESSHVYPKVDHFFSEVERVLSPGGFFCYSDLHLEHKQQAERLEAFIKTKTNLRIIEKHNISKMVQSAVHHRVVVNEDLFYGFGTSLFGYDKTILATELPILARTMGLLFLPWWVKWGLKFKNPELSHVAHYARHSKYAWGKKYYYYYLIQKVGK